MAGTGALQQISRRAPCVRAAAPQQFCTPAARCSSPRSTVCRHRITAQASRQDAAKQALQNLFEGAKDILAVNEKAELEAQRAAGGGGGSGGKGGGDSGGGDGFNWRGGPGDYWHAFCNWWAVRFGGTWEQFKVVMGAVASMIPPFVIYLAMVQTIRRKEYIKIRIKQWLKIPYPRARRLREYWAARQKEWDDDPRSWDAKMTEAYFWWLGINKPGVDPKSLECLTFEERQDPSTLDVVPLFDDPKAELGREREANKGVGEFEQTVTDKYRMREEEPGDMRQSKKKKKDKAKGKA